MLVYPNREKTVLSSCLVPAEKLVKVLINASLSIVFFYDRRVIYLLFEFYDWWVGAAPLGQNATSGFLFLQIGYTYGVMPFPSSPTHIFNCFQFTVSLIRLRYLLSGIVFYFIQVYANSTTWKNGFNCLVNSWRTLVGECIIAGLLMELFITPAAYLDKK